MGASAALETPIVSVNTPTQNNSATAHLQNTVLTAGQCVHDDYDADADDGNDDNGGDGSDGDYLRKMIMMAMQLVMMILLLRSQLLVRFLCM